MRDTPLILLTLASCAATHITLLTLFIQRWFL
jgi:hypothetical protein